MKARALSSLVLVALLAGCASRDLYQPPTAPFEVVGRLALPAQAQDVDILGRYAYVAAGQAGILIIDIGDASNPVLVKILDTVKYAYTIRCASVLYNGVVTDVAFVVEGTEGITTYDITDPPNAYSYGQGSTAVDGNSIWVETREDPSLPTNVYLAESWKGVRIFQTDPAVPGLLRYDGVFAGTRGFANALTVRDGFAYVADDEMGLAVIDARTLQLGEVVLVSSCDAPGNARGVALDGAYAFLACDVYGLTVMTLAEEEVTGFPKPEMLTTLPLAGKSRTIVIRDDIAFIAAQDGGVHLVDVSSPGAPKLLGTALTSFATGLAVASNGLVAVSDRDEGLVILDGHRTFSDRLPPATVIDLAATGTDSVSVRLNWHAPGDDGLSGHAASYEVRYAAAPITSDAAWDSATAVAGVPAPATAGTAEAFEVTGLSPATTYHFALRTTDEAGNVSARSNSPSGTTAAGNVPPILTDFSVSPGGGLADTVFVFEVTYTDYDDEAPVEASVVIDDVAHPMSLESGDYETGARFHYESTLSVGGHHHFFRFADPGHPAVETPAARGPAVGRFLVTLGSPPGEQGRDGDEAEHLVAVSESTWVSDHEVTWNEYVSLVGGGLPAGAVGDHPVERVTWFEAVEACNARSLAEGLTPAYTVSGGTVSWNRDAGGYRLPTEAEWEIAARGGVPSALPGGELYEEACGADSVLGAVAWYCGNAGGATHAVRQKAANAWGLFDMNGNVWEWCWDWYAADPSGGEVLFDPAGPETGSQRVVRGGSWYHFAREARAASRMPYWPNSGDDVVGFRMARTIPAGSRTGR